MAAVLQAVRAAGGSLRQKRWEFYCPVHNDRAGGNPSAWFNADGRNAGTWGCQQGCHKGQAGGGGLLALAQLLDVELPSSTRSAPPPTSRARKGQEGAARPSRPMMDQAQVDAALDQWLEARGLERAHLEPYGGRAEPYTWRDSNTGATYTGPALLLPTARWDDALRVRRLDPGAPSWVSKVKWSSFLEPAPRELDPEGRGQEKRPGCLFGWEEALLRLHAQQLQGEQATLWLVNGHASVVGARAAGLAAVALEAGEGRSSAADWWAGRLAQELQGAGLEEPVVLVAYDNDPTGREGAQAVLAALQKAGGEGLLARQVDLSRHPAAAHKGGDVGDVVARVGLEDAAEALAELATSRWTLPASWSFAEGLGEPEPVDWLVEGLLPADCLAVLYGPPNAGKSLVALDWAARVAQQGPVLYIAGEGAHGLPRRLHAWRLAHPDQALPKDRLVFQKVASSLLDAGHVGDLLAHVQGFQERVGGPLRLIVVDTLARAIPGGDENAASVMGQAVAALDGIRRAAGGPAVLVIHHPGKANGGLRGSSALQGAVDAALELTAQGQEQQGAMVLRSGDLITVRSTKQKDAEAGRRVTYAFRVQELDQPGGMTGACVVDSEVAPAIVTRRPHKEQAALDAVGLAIEGGPATFATLRQAILDAGGSETSAKRWRRDWLAAGILQQDQQGVYTRGPAWEGHKGQSRAISPNGPASRVGPLGPPPYRVAPMAPAAGPSVEDREEEQITLLLGQTPAYDRPRSTGQDCPACGAGAYPSGSCSNPACVNAAAPCATCGHRHNPAGACPPPISKALGG